jgi:hypothetical protein
MKLILHTLILLELVFRFLMILVIWPMNQKWWYCDSSHY